MTDIFRSAFNYISQQAPIRPDSGREHPLVGTSVDVNGTKVKIRSLLAEGESRHWGMPIFTQKHKNLIKK